MRYNPDLVHQGKNPFVIDSKAPTLPLEKYAYAETRYTMLVQSNEDAAEKLLKLAQEDVNTTWKYYEQLAAIKYDGESK